MKQMCNILIVAVAILTAPLVLCAEEIKLESLLGYFNNEKGVFFQVYTGGCTDKDSFVIQSKTNEGVRSIGLYRIIPDFCKAYFPYGVLIKFTYQDLEIQKGQDFKILNPIKHPRREF